jgi:hypothetical protein
MRRHIVKYNILLLIKILEFKQAIALIAIKYKQLVRTYSA